MSYREQSRRDYGRGDYQALTDDQCKVGALLRIADATEVMAKEYNRLLHDLTWYKARCEDQSKTIKHLLGSRAAYKAHLTRMKKKFSTTSIQP